MYNYIFHRIYSRKPFFLSFFLLLLLFVVVVVVLKHVLKEHISASYTKTITKLKGVGEWGGGWGVRGGRGVTCSHKNKHYLPLYFLPLRFIHLHFVPVLFNGN